MTAFWIGQPALPVAGWHCESVDEYRGHRGPAVAVVGAAGNLVTFFRGLPTPAELLWRCRHAEVTT